MHKIIISASILAADLANLEPDVNRALTAGVDYIHFDVMDHHYVPNLSFGAPVCRSLRQAGIKAPIDAHLMVSHPESLIPAFAEAGANLITFHPETVADLAETIKKIKNAGMEAGLAFNPDQPVNVSAAILREIHLLLLMSVVPGFAGQSFVKGSLEKIAQTRKLLNEAKSSAMLGIDGGIKTTNMGEVVRAGADFIVVGSGLFHTADYQQTVNDMRKHQ